MSTLSTLLSFVLLGLLGDDGLQLRVPPRDSDPSTATCRLSNLPTDAVQEFADLPSRDKRWQDLLAIHVVNDGVVLETPMSGSYVLKEGELRFAPRFPFRPGVHYVAVARSEGKIVKKLPFSFAKASGEAARVLQIYPSADTLPENHLRFYIQFSQPIARGSIYKHLELRDDKNQVVVDPFLTLDEELWDPTQQRFTLLFDPGRVKRELLPREELGPAIVAGRHYTLHVLPTLQDANGRNVVPYVKRYKIVAADTGQPQPEKWDVRPPATPNRPLRIEFKESLDWGLLQRVIEIRTAGGGEVDGNVVVGRSEKSWEFTPREPWKPGRYTIMIDSRLEDPAGNSVARPFEVDMLRPVERKVPSDHKRLTFEID